MYELEGKAQIIDKVPYHKGSLLYHMAVLSERIMNLLNYALSSIPLSLQRLVFWHQEVASDSFCFLINCPWLLVFILYLFFLFFSGFNLYCWKGIHFS